MEKSSNSSKIVGDAFRGPSGYETVDEQPLPETPAAVPAIGRRNEKVQELRRTLELQLNRVGGTGEPAAP